MADDLSDVFLVLDSETGKPHVSENAKKYSKEIRADFTKFTSRPEYAVGRIADVAAKGKVSRQTLYETLLAGCALLRANKYGAHDPDGVIDKLQPCIDWLRNSDFYQAPASTRYHDSYVGGLCAHSLRVAFQALTLTQLPAYNGALGNDKVEIQDAVLVALVHDWCKIGFYEPYKRNVKNEFGKWEEVDAFRRNPSGAMVPLGHGVSSMYLASKFFRLSREESLAIRWHMGIWRTHQDEVDELQQANECIPLVHLLQFADQLSITKYATPDELC